MHLTKLQKLMLINAYPIKLIFNSIGGIIALYFLWKRELLYSLILGAIFILGGTLMTIKSKTPISVLADTFFGKVFMRYSTKWGFTCYSISHVIIPISFWCHNLYLAAMGTFFLLIGLVKFGS